MENHLNISSRLVQLQTPCLIIDECKMQANINRLANHAQQLGVKLRPHLKTVKSVDVTNRILVDGCEAVTVSTLAEAEVFANSGVTDILYAVGISPQKFSRVKQLREAGCDITVLLDSIEQAEALRNYCAENKTTLPALIEIDSDGHRGGISANDPNLLKVGEILASCDSLKGVMAHAGESYGAVGAKAHSEFSEKERAATVAAAKMLTDSNLPCPLVSIGSTPTALAARDLSGVSELRAGVYVFFDLVMAGIEVCSQEEIALSVLTTVIGYQANQGRILIDAGWMALSRDRGTAEQDIDQGYGVVCDVQGQIYPDLIVSATNQEHGIITHRDGKSVPNIPIGTQLRILPNHACATAAQHSHYNVIQKTPGASLLTWSRFGGW